jgi:hypothetical protein
MLLLFGGGGRGVGVCVMSVGVCAMPVAVCVPLHTARTLWPKGGGLPALVPRYMLVPRNTMRSMHKVMRFVHGLR